MHLYTTAARCTSMQLKTRGQSPFLQQRIHNTDKSLRAPTDTGYNIPAQLEWSRTDFSQRPQAFRTSGEYLCERNQLQIAPRRATTIHYAKSVISSSKHPKKSKGVVKMSGASRRILVETTNYHTLWLIFQIDHDSNTALLHSSHPLCYDRIKEECLL